MLINGQATKTLSALDRGLQFGDGIFETIAVKDGHIAALDLHLQRLQHGCATLRITPPDTTILQREIQQLIQPNCVIKITITRGNSQRGYTVEAQSKPTRIVACFPLPIFPAHYRTAGITVRLCETRLARQPQLAGIKHLNRLENVLARAEWHTADIADGLLLDTADNLIETTARNLFLAINHQWVTPDLRHAGIAGIMRQRVLTHLAEQGTPAVIRDIAVSELPQVDAAFVCNSISGLWHIRRIVDKNYGKSLSINPALRALLNAF